MQNALITGVTGFIGGELARHVFESQKYEIIYIVCRAHGAITAQARFEKVVKKWEDVHGKAFDLSKFEVIDQDLFQCGKLDFPSDVTHIFHCAASTRFDESLTYARNNNLYATQKLVLWARGLKGLQRFVLFSTAFVCGDRRGPIRETDLPGKFQNNYEKTKYEAEQLVQSSKLPYLIVRPSIVVGDSTTGYTQHFRIFYSMLRVWLQGQLPRAPLHRKTCVDMVPVDFVCRGALGLTDHQESLDKTYHLCAGGDGLVDPISVFQYAIKVFDLGTPPISPVWVIHVLNFPLIRFFVSRPIKAYLKTMGGHFPYMEPVVRRYSMEDTRKILAKDGIECPRLNDYGDRMFRFCKESNWGRNLRGLRDV